MFATGPALGQSQIAIRNSGEMGARVECIYFRLGYQCRSSLAAEEVVWFNRPWSNHRGRSRETQRRNEEKRKDRGCAGVHLQCVKGRWIGGSDFGGYAEAGYLSIRVIVAKRIKEWLSK